MKNIGKLLLLSSFFFLSSCDDGLLEPYIPGAQVEEVAVQNSADLQKLMNRAYTLLTPLEEIQFSSIFTDEVGIGFANGGQGLTNNYVFLLNSGSASPANIWTANYFTLAVVNRVIKFSNNVTAVDAVDQELINKLKAEAFTLRAHCHNQLIAYFSTNPKDLNALGVALSNDVFPTTITPARVSNGQVYNLIDQDLLAAENLYATVTTLPKTNPIFANVNFTKATKARSYALRGDYPNALIAADDVINTSGLTLATFANYKNVFHTDNQPASVEVIFKLKKTTGQTKTGNIWANVNATINGAPYFEVGRSLFNIMLPNALTDVRYSTNVSPSSLIDPNYATSGSNYPQTDKLIIRKYPGRTDSGNLVNDMKISRLSEMYLIRAEAYVAANNLPAAATAVKAIRDARFSSVQLLPVYADATAAWKDILKERRVEFAFEGYRFIDLKRLGTLAGEGILRDPKDCETNGACSLQVNDYRFALPIPSVETNANSVIQQNPGY
ncbi:RagB/SusD family nutrient uptake outer membrane protein [Flavobacterium sp.]|uniref:RagB/SusD family nutrient uptake outer membrane protein n=1 Tax=Flavobacterium sp. TaxID=239 RepID=UPI003D6AA594